MNFCSYSLPPSYVTGDFASLLEKDKTSTEIWSGSSVKMDLRLVRRGRETSEADDATEITEIDLKGWW
jgi:hypothetical protein